VSLINNTRKNFRPSKGYGAIREKMVNKKIFFLHIDVALLVPCQHHIIVAPFLIFFSIFFNPAVFALREGQKSIFSGLLQGSDFS